MNCEDAELFDFENNATIALITIIYDFKDWYSVYHPGISVILCVVGILANLVHIWVLSRPRMRSTSVHTVLTCIAVADIGTMSSYFTYMIRFEFHRDPNGYDYGWALFLKVHVVLSIALHAIGLYLVVLMAFIRVSAMKVAKSSWLHPQIAALASLLIAFVIFVLCIPTLLAHQIKISTPVYSEGHASFKYSIEFSDMVMKDNCALMKMNLWLTGILLKAMPCFLLFGLTLALIARLKENRAKRKALLKSKEDSKSKKRNEHTTYMLLLMVGVFLCTELVQGIMAILNAMYTTQFHQYVYRQLADVLDLLSLINCYVGFLVYISTSSRYRQTLWSFFQCCSDRMSALSTRQNTLVTHRDKTDKPNFHSIPQKEPPHQQQNGDFAKATAIRVDSRDIVREQLL